MKDILPGGRADKSKPSDFDKKEIERGSKHEREHTDNKQITKEIAMDHLKEDPKYYDKLEKMEKSAFWRGFSKQSATRSELVGTVLNPLSAALAVPAAAAGFIRGPRRADDKDRVNKKSWSNVLIPGLAPYRLGRRLAGEKPAKKS